MAVYTNPYTGEQSSVADSPDGDGSFTQPVSESDPDKIVSSLDTPSSPVPRSRSQRSSRGYVPVDDTVSSLDNVTLPAEPSSPSSDVVNTTPSVSEGEEILSSYLASNGSVRTSVRSADGGSTRVVDIDSRTGLVVREKTVYGRSFISSNSPLVERENKEVSKSEASFVSPGPEPVSTAAVADLLRFDAPADANLAFQSTTRDMNKEINLGGLFVPQETKGGTPDGLLSTDVDTRSSYVKTKTDLKNKLFTQGDTEPVTFKESLVAPVAFVTGVTAVAADVGVGFVKAGVGAVKALTVNLPETVGGLVTGVADVVTGKDTVSGKIGALSDAATESFYANPAEFAGGAVFVVAGGKVIGEVGSAAKNVYVKAGSTFVEPEAVFASSVLKGAENLPKTSSTADSLARFSKADDVVATASPAKLEGSSAGLGRKGAVGIEDTGIYVTPAGEASPYFLRLGGEAEYNFFSVNPVSSVRSALDVPTVTLAKTSGVSKYPRNVVEQPGFTAVREFQESQAGSGKAFITKRSEIGQGEISRKSYIAPDDFSEGSFNIKRGDTLVEAGTSEIEAVIPSTQSYAYNPQSTAGKIKGFDSYTTINGRNVALRDTVLVTDDAAAVLRTSDANPTKVFSSEAVAAEQSYLASSGSKGVTSPAFAAGIVSGDSPISGGSSVPPVTTSSLPYATVRPVYSSQTVNVTAPFSSPTRPAESASVVNVPSRVLYVPSPVYTPSSGGSSSGGSGGVSPPVGGSSPVVSIVDPISRVVPSSVSRVVPASRASASFGSVSGGSAPYYPGIPSVPSSSKSERRSGFGVFVRERGVFRRASPLAFTQAGALDVGSSIVGNAPSATFFTRRVSGKVSSVAPSVQGSFARLRSNFYRKGNLFIERRERRIKSGGEKAGITVKGIAANKNKNKFKELLNFGK